MLLYRIVWEPPMSFDAIIVFSSGVEQILMTMIKYGEMKV
jgi:hypothetical protein